MKKKIRKKLCPSELASGLTPARVERIRMAILDDLTGKSLKLQKVYRVRFRCFSHFLGQDKKDWCESLTRFYALEADAAERLFRTYQSWLKKRYSQGVATSFSSGFGRLSRMLRARRCIDWELLPIRLLERQKWLADVPPESWRLLDAWRHGMKEEGKAPESIDSMTRCVLRFGAFLGRRRRLLLKARKSDALAWIKEEELRGMGLRTRNREISVVKSLFDWMFRAKLLRKDPMKALLTLRMPKVLPVFLEKRDLSRIFQATNTLFERTLVEVLYATGCKASEAERLDVGDISLADHSIRYSARPASRSVMPIGRPAARWVKRYLAWRAGFLSDLGVSGEKALFVGRNGRRVRVGYLQYVLHRVGQRARCGKPLTATALRYSVGAHMRDNGADLQVVQTLLGHDEVSTTSRYDAIATAPLEEIYARSHPREW